MNLRLMRATYRWMMLTECLKCMAMVRTDKTRSRISGVQFRPLTASIQLYDVSEALPTFLQFFRCCNRWLMPYTV